MVFSETVKSQRGPAVGEQSLIWKKSIQLPVHWSVLFYVAFVMKNVGILLEDKSD